MDNVNGRQGRRHVAIVLVLACAVTVGCSGPPADPVGPIGRTPLREYATDSALWGEVTLDIGAVEAPRVSDADRRALLENIEHYQRAWLTQDEAALRDLLAGDTIRVSQISGLSEGVEEVIDALSVEWGKYERPYGTLAMNFEVRDLELDVHGDVATALSRIHVQGGARWAFERRALGFDVHRRAAGSWELIHHVELGIAPQGLALRNPAAADASAPLREMGFVYPAEDLERAVAFYAPLMGEPEWQSRSRACFNLNGARFCLDTTTLDGLVVLRKGLPNGYAEFAVLDLERELRRLDAAGVRVLRTPATLGVAAGVPLAGPDGNVFVLRERVSVEDSQATPRLTVAPSTATPSELLETVTRLWNGWLHMDLDGTLGQLSPSGYWIADSRTRGLVSSQGKEEIGRGLTAVWGRYDHGASGMAVEMAIKQLTARMLGELALVSYEYTLTGLDAERFSETGVAVQVLERDPSGWRINTSIVLPVNSTNATVLSLDYTGYPVRRLGRVERFYTDTMRLGAPYHDTGYRGWWLRNSVFGIYRSTVERDGVPRPRRTNGYVSFRVDSVDEVYGYLRQRGSSFPVIPAINGSSGVDAQPGYTQLVSTDSEGNIVLFTEYPGT